MKTKTCKIIILCIGIVLLIASIFSFIKFNVINPISSLCGIIQILYTDTSYTIVQHFPKKVIFSKTGHNNLSSKDFLNDYMEKQKYRELEEQRTGATLVYTNGHQIQKIDYTINKYYAKWQWN